MEMETYIKLYDWMAPIPLPDRLVYALVFQLTQAGMGCWADTPSVARRLGISRDECRKAIDRLKESGALEESPTPPGEKHPTVLKATRRFASLARARTL